MKPSQPNIDEIFEKQIQVLATTLRPSSVTQYRSTIRIFLRYLSTTFPRLRQLSQLHRNPHMLGWFCFLAQQDPPLCNATRRRHLILVRRLLSDLADNSYPAPADLIRRDDFPLPDHYLPRPLSPEDDHRLQLHLRKSDTLEAHALRLMRGTGIRIGECIDLPPDCLQSVSKHEHQAALRVPLGKLHSERWVPVDEEIRHIVVRMLELRASAPSARSLESKAFLLPRYRGRERWMWVLRHTLAETARDAGCTSSVTPHRLRHAFATEMVRLGVSLPALMQMLGHKDIRMTLRYVEVAQLDIQREFYRARKNTVGGHSIPQLPLATVSTRADLPAIRQAIAAAQHLFQLFRPQLEPHAQAKLHRLSQRLLNIRRELDHLTSK